MSAPTILTTKDYSIFKSVGFNRDKQKKHIQLIKKTLQKSNYLHLHPILVNQEMEVVDGQHRLEAARELGLEIFYIKSEIAYEHILTSNLIQKKLSLSDVVKFYAVKEKLPDYIKMREFLITLQINPKAILGLMFGSSSPALIELLKSGKFKLPLNTEQIDKTIDHYMNFVWFCKEKRITPFSMFSSFHFTIAFRNLSTLTSFNETIFKSKLEMRWFEMKPQMNAKEWTKNLIDIYNWKNQNPIRFNEIDL